jgi:Tfp pilus assembly protein PilV
MASVLILGFGLFFVVNSYAVALKGADAAQNNIQAAQLAQEKMESLEISALKGVLPGYRAQGIIETPLKQYGYSITISEISGPQYLAQNLAQACLNIEWQEQNSTKNVIFSAYLPKQKE